MYKVKLWIRTVYSSGSDLEEVVFASERSLAGAKSKASRWMNKHYFASDLAEAVITKEQLSEYSDRADWTIRFSA